MTQPCTNSLLLSTPNSLPLRMWCSRFFMSKGLRFIRLSEASSPAEAPQGSFKVATQGSDRFSPRVSVLYFLTRAVQAASQLSGHHLHDEAHPQPQHVPKQRRLGAHVHGQIHHDLLSDEPAERLHSNEKNVSERCEGGKLTDLPEWEQRRWCPDRWLRRSACSTPPVEVGWREKTIWIPLWSFILLTCVFWTYTVMTLSLGSGGRPTVSCLWWEIRSVQAWGTCKHTLIRMVWNLKTYY